MGSRKGFPILAVQAWTPALSCTLRSFQGIPGQPLPTRLTGVHCLKLMIALKKGGSGDKAMSQLISSLNRGMRKASLLDKILNSESL